MMRQLLTFALVMMSAPAWAGDGLDSTSAPDYSVFNIREIKMTSDGLHQDRQDYSVKDLRKFHKDLMGTDLNCVKSQVAELNKAIIGKGITDVQIRLVHGDSAPLDREPAARCEGACAKVFDEKVSGLFSKDKKILVIHAVFPNVNGAERCKVVKAQAIEQAQLKNTIASFPPSMGGSSRGNSADAGDGYLPHDAARARVESQGLAPSKQGSETQSAGSSSSKGME